MWKSYRKSLTTEQRPCSISYHALASADIEPGDREKAMSLLDESLAISSELGMRPLMERVLSRREILRW